MKPSFVSQNRLKIFVSDSELDRTGSDTRERISDIIAKACRQTGFTLSYGRLMVETVKAENGFNVCVTRLPGANMPVCCDNERRSSETEPYVFEFDSLFELLSAGEAVLRHSDVLLCSLNVIYSSKRWFLTFSPVLAGLDGYRLDCLLSNVGEFGEQLAGGKLMQLRLIENGRVAASGSDAERLFHLVSQSADASFAFETS